MVENVTVPPFDNAPSIVVGETPQDVFAFSFPFWDSADVLVIVDGVTLDPGEYTVEGLLIQEIDGEEEPVIGGFGSGIITLVVPVSSVTVIIDRMVVGSRETQFSRAAPLAMTALNADLNKLTARQQDLRRLIGSGGAGGLPLELIDDRIVSLLEAGEGVTLTYDDDAGLLTISADGSLLTPQTVGVVAGEDSTSVKISALLAYAVAQGKKTIAFGPGPYRVKRNPPGTHLGGILLQSGVSIEGRGARLVCAEDNALLYGVGDYENVEVTANVAAGALTVTVANGAEFTAGDDVVWRLGDLPYDLPETDNFGFARVVSVVGNAVTLDTPIRRAFTYSGSLNNRWLARVEPIQKLRISDIELDVASGSTTEAGISLAFAKDIVVERITARRTGAGIVLLQYCENITLRDLSGYGSIATQASFGRGVTIAECHGIQIDGLRLRAYEKSALVAEAASQVVVRNLHDTNTIDYVSGERRAIISALGKSEVLVQNLRVDGLGDFITNNISNGVAGYEGRVTIHNATFDLADEAYQIPSPGRALTGRLLYSINGVLEQYDTDGGYWWERTFLLRDGEYLVVMGPHGIVGELKAYASASCDSGDVASVFVGRGADNGGDLGASVLPGYEVTLPTFCGAVGGILWTMRDQALRFLIIAGASGITGEDKFLRLRSYVVPNSRVAYQPEEEAVRATGNRDYMEGEVSYNPPSLVNGAAATVAVTVPGAIVGDFVEAIGFTVALAGLNVSGEITANDTATITFRNLTGSTVDAGAGTVRVRVARPRLGI